MGCAWYMWYDMGIKRKVGAVNMMTRKDVEDVRSYIRNETGVWGGSISVYENGTFEIRDIDEFDVNRIYSILMRDERFSGLYRSHKYDYSHFDYRLMPKVKYTVRGQFN